CIFYKMIARPWTDDLPKCKNSCVASYFSRLGGGNTNTTDDYLCFYCQTEDNFSLYGVFEPHNGLDAARFIMQRMAAEILFPPPSANTDEEIRERLRNAFISVEKAYIENYDGMIAERTSLQYQLQTLNETQVSQNYNILARLKEIDVHLSGGAAVVIALVHANKLFVAHVGDTRALLCRTDDNAVLRVVQLTVDHSLNNEDELLRLQQLGLDVNNSIPRQPDGDALPRFLVLVSAGVYKRIQEAKGSYEQTNKQLAQIIVENFRKHDFRMVSQSVLEEIEQEFVSYCVKNSLTPKPNTHMSLLIRNFNFLPTVEDETPPTHSVTKNASVRFNPIVQSKSNTLLNEIDSEIYSSGTNEIETNDSNIDTNRSIESTSDIYPVGRPFDRDRKIKGYVDFSCYFENVAKARKNGTLPDFIK
ncbi:hypothetical protein HW555_012600, partial [Spodoptera exigua]